MEKKDYAFGLGFVYSEPHRKLRGTVGFNYIAVTTYTSLLKPVLGHGVFTIGQDVYICFLANDQYLISTVTEAARADMQQALKGRPVVRAV